MDATEKRLTDNYNAILDELKRVPKGDPRHIPVVARLTAAHRALRKYQQRKKN